MTAAFSTSSRLRLLSAPETSVERLNAARQNLTIFVHEEAERASQRLGFGWRATELAPSSFDDLLREHAACLYSGLPLRVSSRFCEQTIYVDEAGSHAMRFWHDSLHVALDLTFEAGDEMEVACHQLEMLRWVGFDAPTPEYRLLHADTIGQTLCVAMLGRFPRDQLAFATAALEHGVDAAIRIEAKSGSKAAGRPRRWTPPDGEAA